MYLRLLRLPGVRRLVLAALMARIPSSMNVTAAILLVQGATHSFAVAGAVEGVNAVASAASGPLLGRLVDRVGQTRVLVGAVGGFAAGLWGLVAAAHAGAPAVVLAALAAVAGAGIPPVSACMRSLWPGLVAGTEVPVATAFALESVTVEAFFIVGPLLAGAIIVLASPGAALVVAGGLAVAGTVTFATAPASRRWRPDTVAARSPAGALGARGIRALVAALLPFGAAFGALSVALPAFAVGHGSPGATGLFWAVQAVGSAAGGLWYGARTWRRPLARRYLELLALFAVGLAPLALAGSIPVLCVLIALGGLALAPVTAASFELTDRVAPAGARTEAFTWVVTANVAGSAAGAAVTGAVVQSGGPAAGFLLGCGLALAAVALAVAARGALRPVA
jgi:MFS family permease